MASNLETMASNLIAMASNLEAKDGTIAKPLQIPAHEN